jgi:hypothetical protein
MVKNPILDELHAVRQRLLEESGGTLDALVDRLQAEEQRSDRPRFQPCRTNGSTATWARQTLKTRSVRHGPINCLCLSSRSYRLFCSFSTHIGVPLSLPCVRRLRLRLGVKRVCVFPTSCLNLLAVLELLKWGGFRRCRGGSRGCGRRCRWLPLAWRHR